MNDLSMVAIGAVMFGLLLLVAQKPFNNCGYSHTKPQQDSISVYVAAPELSDSLTIQF